MNGKKAKIKSIRTRWEMISTSTTAITKKSTAQQRVQGKERTNKKIFS